MDNYEFLLCSFLRKLFKYVGIFLSRRDIITQNHIGSYVFIKQSLKDRKLRKSTSQRI